ncbi:MAG: hypothetical protein FIB01_07570 [Gemmatimonadetes bacterium]|nr:hypothetical protein [Gemmatimonadota bacterium]
MDRRSFITTLTAAAAPLAFGRPRPLPAARGAPRITGLSFTPIEGRFHKFVAMNSYDTRPKGHTYENTLVRIATDQGVEGVGVMEYAAPNDAFLAAVQVLVGADPLSVYTLQDGRITGRADAFAPLLARYQHLDGPLFDLVGKLTARPAWQLLGSAQRDTVEAYDGTLYFSDVWFQDRGVRAVVEEAEEAVRMGYPALKLKTGRGWRWLEKEAGLRRDIEVVQAVRRAIGPGVRIQVDPNNGYRNDVEDAWRFLEATQADDIHMLEEPFPEAVARYTALRQRMAAAGLKTQLADGENMTGVAPFRPYLDGTRLIDVLQLDIRRGGFLDAVELARLGAPLGAVLISHNWGSQVGLFMALHVAKAVANVPAAEDDRSTCDVIVAHGYEYHDGRYRVSDEPGLGLEVDRQVYDRKYATAARVVGTMS